MDMEKVIKEKLDEMVELTRGLSYAGFMTAVENANDILAMLKEQEALKPFTDNEGLYWCASCKEDVVWHQKYCSNCGKPINWKGL